MVIQYCWLCKNSWGDFYWNVYELFIKDNFRELGLGTKLFEYIADNANMKNFEVRSFALQVIDKQKILWK